MGLLTLSRKHSVPTTNTTVERDFGMLDRLMREKPSASTLALEAMIMYNKLHNGQSLAEEERSKYLCLARKPVALQKRFVERLTTIQEGRKQKHQKKTKQTKQNKQTGQKKSNTGERKTRQSS